ncbi:hypothetical protein [Cellulomonas denverensis]|uniref:Uncharacterized protein n=1 Tax=Cellulomonas denverensis TaxID=264297 RepID=A0A7X6KUQ5_9CELL|nr:hypothetical protein [Cellulomonas denverensis]NKY22440.1 hypothetical protein [Cellulomonas denverensis]GIG25913.1 hypothetical protein Cde04nite_21570 [Cellulomonas denverensis]
MRARTLLTTAAVASTAAVAGARLRARLPQPPQHLDRPPAITVLLSGEELDARRDGLSAEHRDLLDACRRTPAPGDRGTELRPSAAGPDTRQQLRLLKQVLETGHTLPPDDTGDRPATPGGKLLDLAISQAGRRGRL